MWTELAKKTALANGEFESESSSAVSLLQKLSLTLHRENARAVVRRLACPTSPAVGEALSIAATIAEDAEEYCP